MNRFDHVEEYVMAGGGYASPRPASPSRGASKPKSRESGATAMQRAESRGKLTAARAEKYASRCRSEEKQTLCQRRAFAASDRDLHSRVQENREEDFKWYRILCQSSGGSLLRTGGMPRCGLNPDAKDPRHDKWLRCQQTPVKFIADEFYKISIWIH